MTETAEPRLEPRQESFAEPLLLHEFFERAARRWPDRPAIDVPPGRHRPRRTVSYAELTRLAARVAARLRELVVEESIVAILLPRTSHLPYAAQLGVLQAGAAHACLDPAHPDGALASILADARPVALLTDAAGSERARGAGLHTGALIDVGELLADARDPAPVPQPHWLTPRSLAYLIYTSGTTGAPKGVMIEHRSVVNLVASDRETFALLPDDRIAQGSSLAYDSSVEEVWLAFAQGACLVVADDDTARLGPDLVPWLAHERITVLCPTPTLLRTTGCTDPERLLPALRLLYVGGEALPRDLADRWARGRHMENGYGPTECTVTVVRGRIRAGEPITIGRPIRGNLAWVLDRELAEVADGEAGELCIGGIGLARGYRGRPEATAERFVLHPRIGRIYRTGDIVCRGGDGGIDYLGRADVQVKLRGHRVELEAIEVALAACPGVRAAACRVDGTGPDQRLVAFVVADSPEEPPSSAQLRAALRERLPEPLVPNRFAFVGSLPTSISGKLDRRAVGALAVSPQLQRGDARPLLSPRNEIERTVHAAFRSCLQRTEDFSVEDDFFFDLGGESLRAAEIVSVLRDDPATVALTVRDLYEARTVAALALRAGLRAGPVAAPANGNAASAGALNAVREPAWAADRPRPLVAGAVQAACLGLGLCAGSASAWLLAFRLLPELVSTIGWLPLLAAFPLVVFLATLLSCPLLLGLTVCVKRLLIGRYRPLRTPVWSSEYVRHWIVRRCAALVPWGMLQGTALHAAALRALGARVGRRLHVHRGVDLAQGGWDLLAIGDDVTLAQDAMVRLAELDDGELVIGPVTLGDRATLDVRAGVAPHGCLEEEAFLCALSALPAHGRIPRGERWAGVPAAPAGKAPQTPPLPAGHRDLAPASHAVATLLGRLGLSYVFQTPLLVLAIAGSIAAGIDGRRVTDWMAEPSADAAALLAASGLLSVGLVLGLVARALVLRALGAVPPGVIGRWTLPYLRVWSKDGLLQPAGDWLSGTLFWPVWLRLAGMRIGRKCEISTLLDVVPERIAIGPESFLADGIYLGGPLVHRGTVTIGDTQLGRETFLGNHVVVPTGTRLPDRVLLGISTAAEGLVPRAGSAWFGHPAFELPRREIVACDRRLTHDPGLLRYSNRVFWELLRFALPVAPVLLSYAWFAAVSGAGDDAWSGIAVAAAATAGVLACLCALVVAFKWLLLGRVRPGQHALWSGWCSRWDFLYVAWRYWAARSLTQLEGTPFLASFLRAMGCRIGADVVLGEGFAQVVDPDMLAIEDGATVDGMIQAHSFEDRVLKIDHVRVRGGATVGRAVVLMYGADIGAGARVAPHSVVMKHERLLPGVTYEGCPVRPARTKGSGRMRARYAAAEALPAGASESTPPFARGRQPALDAARGLAVLGMIYLHLVPSEGDASGLERAAAWAAELAQGKPAALFCFLAGVAWALQAARTPARSRRARFPVRRALVLGVAGVLFESLPEPFAWSTEILLPMALMMLACAPALRARARRLALPVLCLLALVPIAYALFGHHAEHDWNVDGSELAATGFGWATLRALLYDGTYPLLPWLVFPLIGIAFASFDWTAPGRARRAFCILLPLALLCEGASRLAAAYSGELGALAPYLTSTWEPTSIPFVVVGVSWSLALTTGFLWWHARERRLVRGFATLGRASLTHYLLHILVVFSALRLAYPEENWSIATGLLACAGYLAVAWPLTSLWFRRFRRGPFEALWAWAAPAPDGSRL